MTLYNAFVRTKLEYCSTIWTPFYNVHIAEIENVQRKFCKYVYFKKYHAYPVQGYPQDRLLLEFNMHSLELRRNQVDDGRPD